MSIYSDKFFADKAVGALWDVAVSIKRGNPLPLDKDSVVHGIAELNAIAAGAVSYPGQIIAVIEDAVYDSYIENVKKKIIEKLEAQEVDEFEIELSKKPKRNYKKTKEATIDKPKAKRGRPKKAKSDN